MSELHLSLDGLVDEIVARVVAELDGGVPAELPEPWRLLTVEEVCARLGRSDRWVRERKAQIGYIRLDGGALAFDLEDVKAFARSRRIPDDSSGGGGVARTAPPRRKGSVDSASRTAPKEEKHD